MVSPSYMLKKGSGPSAFTRTFNQAVIPALIGAATDLEVTAEILRVSVVRYPALALALAFWAGTLSGRSGRRKKKGWG